MGCFRRNEHWMCHGNVTLHPVSALAAASASTPESKQAGDGVDEEGEDNRIEPEGEHAVYKREAPHSTRSNLDIGDLTSHADDEREIGKVEIIRHAFARKFETGSMSILAELIAVAVKSVGVVQTENGVHCAPGKDNGRQSENQMHGEMTADVAFVDADQKSHREQRRARHHHDENENGGSPNVLLLGAAAQLILRCGQDREPGKCEHKKRKCVPSCNHGRGKPRHAPQRKEDGGGGHERDDEAVSCVLSGNQIETQPRVSPAVNV